MLRSLWTSVAGWLKRVTGPAKKSDDASAAPQSTYQPPGAGDHGLRSAMRQLHTTLRWIIVSFGAIAAILVGTAPLDKLGAVDAGSTRFWVMLATAAVAILAVSLAIMAAAAVDQPLALSIVELVTAEDPAAAWPKSYGDRKEIAGAVAWMTEGDFIDTKQVCALSANHPAVLARDTKPIAFANAERDAARDAWERMQCEIEAAQAPAARAALTQRHEGLRMRFERLDAQLDVLIDLGNYWRLERRFTVRKRIIAVCAIVAALGLLGFKYTANLKPHPERDLTGIALGRAVGVDLRHANLAGADLTGADLTRTDLRSADLTGARLTEANLAAARLGGADLTAVDLTGARNLTVEQVKSVTNWISATCPNGERLVGAHTTCATEAQLTPQAG